MRQVADDFRGISLGGINESTEKVLRVAAFTGGRTISSRRFRVMQYIPRLLELGIQIDENVAHFGSWPPPSKLKRPWWLAATLLDRLPGVARSYRYDVTLLQRELVSTLLTLEKFTHRPRVLDVDDAVWLNPRSDKTFASLIGDCDGVICGNEFIAENVKRWNQELIVLPTAVDTDRFRPASVESDKRQIIGWSGLNSGAKYLLNIERALLEVLRSRKDAILRVVSDVRPKFLLLGGSQVEFVKWSPENEVATIQEMSVGLMPIDDSLWSRGKCSYKMLLYMSCGVPVVVSPFGMNEEVLSRGKVGFGPRSHSEWVECITWMLDNPERAKEIGMLGRRVIEDHYSLNLLAPRMASYLKTFNK